jgi:formylglycine-generating enzyme required for sulfatase activity
MRLPTELEWQFTVTSRGRNFYFPWTAAATTTLDCDHVIFDFGGDASPGGGCGFPDSGPAAAGATEQGVLDLAGRVFEWVWDVGAAFPVDAGPNYAGPPGDGGVMLNRVRRGGSFNSLPDDNDVKNFYRVDYFSGTEPYDDLGFRCAKSL